jgi:hypothetical protein
LKKAGRAGRQPRLSAEQISQVEQGLKRGAQALDGVEEVRIRSCFCCVGGVFNRI